MRRLPHVSGVASITIRQGGLRLSERIGDGSINRSIYPRRASASPLCSGGGAVRRIRFELTEQLHGFVGGKNAARPNKGRHIGT
jgi:hypothetical protein